jgi:hypothetical protein
MAFAERKLLADPKWIRPAKPVLTTFVAFWFGDFPASLVLLTPTLFQTENKNGAIGNSAVVMKLRTPRAAAYLSCGMWESSTPVCCGSL